MSIQTTPREELFVLPGNTRQRYLYAPLRRFIAALNDDAISLAARYNDDPGLDLITAEQAILEELQTHGLFTNPYPQLPDVPERYLFRPHEVTLFLTTKCNLRCTYCYADGGSRDIDMPDEIAEAAINCAVANALAVNRNDFILGFHGGGEPTFNWRAMCHAVDYAKSAAQNNGLEVKIHTASNGVLSLEQREYIINNFTGVNISMDGPEDIQNKQRPLPNGEGSFQRVMQSLRHFHEVGFPFGIRVTLTAEATERLPEITRFFKEEFPNLDQLHVEPVWQCGRCLSTGETTPEEERFIEKFTQAYQIAKGLGYRLFYSGARPDVITSKFCAAPGDGFSVTPEGYVTSCYEVDDRQDARAELFHYGYYDTNQHDFVFNMSKIDRLRKLHVANLEYCQNCFCKWHCAGDCLAKALKDRQGDSHSGSPRCNINRAITAMQIIDMAHRSHQKTLHGDKKNGKTS